MPSTVIDFLKSVSDGSINQVPKIFVTLSMYAVDSLCPDAEICVPKSEYSWRKSVVIHGPWVDRDRFSIYMTIRPGDNGLKMSLLAAWPEGISKSQMKIARGIMGILREGTNKIGPIHESSE